MTDVEQLKTAQGLLALMRLTGVGPAKALAYARGERGIEELDSEALERAVDTAEQRLASYAEEGVVDCRARRQEPGTAASLDPDGVGLVLGALSDRDEVDVVVSIPPHAGRRDRFIGYRRMACAVLGASDDIDVRIAHAVSADYKRLSRDQKRALRAGRYACHDDLSRHTVLVIDDVTTTGSTLGAMADALYEAGAARVIRFAWAVTQD
jgi:hypothetical protein